MIGGWLLLFCVQGSGISGVPVRCLPPIPVAGGEAPCYKLGDAMTRDAHKVPGRYVAATCVVDKSGRKQ